MHCSVSDIFTVLFPLSVFSIINKDTVFSVKFSSIFHFDALDSYFTAYFVAMNPFIKKKN